MILKLYDDFIFDNEVKLLIDQYKEDTSICLDAFRSRLYRISGELELIIKLKYNLIVSVNSWEKNTVYMVGSR